jgi:hypothetical protein
MADELSSIRVFTDVVRIPCSRSGFSSWVAVAVQDVFDGLLQSCNELVTSLEEVSPFLLYLQRLEIAWVGIERRG